eukprot:1232338-Prymnesium_polylepis.1
MAVESASRERAAAYAARPGRTAVAVARTNGKAREASKGEGALARGIRRGWCGKRARSCSTSVLSGGVPGWARRMDGLGRWCAPGAVIEDTDVVPVPCERVARARQRCAFGS